ncbi:DoxX family protein [Flavobacterium zepuense]|nr:DoxX family protein [Flavobacterium zepuense]
MSLAFPYFTAHSSDFSASRHPYTQEMVAMGMPAGTPFTLSCILLPCLIVYFLPRTSAIGAILLTGYMGGAIVAHWRVGEAFAHCIAVILLLWTGLCLRDTAIWQSVNPFRTR